MKVQCSNCQKQFKVASLEKLGNSPAKFRFTCSACGQVEVLRKDASETWPQYFDRTSHPPAAVQADYPLPEVPPSVPADEQAMTDAAPPAAGSPASESQVNNLFDEPPKKANLFSGLTGKVVLLMLLVSLLPLGIYSIVMNTATVQRIEDDTDRNGQQITSGLVSQVNEWMDKNLRVLQAASQLPDMQTMNGAAQESILKAIAANYPWKYLVFTVDTAGKNIARSDGQSLLDYSDRQYYKDIVFEKKPFTWQTLIGRTSKKPALILSVPIKRGDEIVGVLAAGMNIEEISDNIVKWRLGRTGFAFLVDQTGKVVAHQVDEFVQTEKVLKTHPLIANFKRGQNGMQRFSENGVEKVGFVRETRWLWKVAIQQDDDEVFALLRQANQFALSLLGIAVVLVIVVATLASRAIVRPIKQLTEAAEKISTGDLEVQIDIKAKNEIGELAIAIRRMQDSIRFAIGRLKRARNARAASHQPAQRDALSQNPF